MTDRLSTDARPIDYARSATAIRAWRTADEQLFHGTMSAIMSDPDRSATPGFMFAAIDGASRALDLLVEAGLVSEQDILKQLQERETLLQHEQDLRGD